MGYAWAIFEYTLLVIMVSIAGAAIFWGALYLIMGYLE
jgi:preprotein translocase subunit SecE